MPEPEDLLLPAATRLVHIGPHKTGTSALQGAFHTSRQQLAEHGVHYAGKELQPGRAALYVAGQPTLLGERTPQLGDWDELVADVAAAGQQRVVISSEFLSEADDAAAHPVVEELGGTAVHVVVTLRPLSKILPSQWQQMVQNGLRTPYEAWLESIVKQPTGSATACRIWQRHHHGRLVRRWAEAAGPERLTVIVVDENDPKALPRTFEQLLGLPNGFLVHEPDQANRSLTLAEAEIVRQINRQFRALKWPEAIYARYVRRGAVLQLKTGRQPLPDEPRIATPAWALSRAAELGAEFADTIAGLGVRVIGDLPSLGRLPEYAAEPTADAIPASAAAAAAQAVIGAVAVTGDHDPAQPVEDMRVRQVRTGTLVRVIAQRIARRLTTPLRATDT